MPELTLPQMRRREFLTTSTAVAGAFLTLNLTHNQGAAQDEIPSTHWALLSDTHVPEDPANEYRGFMPYDQFKQVVPKVIEADPEGIIISGDLARLQGLAGDYAAMKSLIQPLAEKKPICMALGNHDDRANFKPAFTDTHGEMQSVENKHVIVVNAPPVRFLVLDSLLYVNQVAGLLGKNQRVWLTEYLSQSDSTPTLLVFHHSLRDTDGDLLDADKLFQIIAMFPQVKAMIYGHSHVYPFETRDGIHLINLPAVAYNFRDEDAVGWVEARLTAQGGEFTLHALGGNTKQDGQVTTLKWRA